jgi:hypothetical protein
MIIRQDRRGAETPPSESYASREALRLVDGQNLDWTQRQFCAGCRRVKKEKNFCVHGLTQTMPWMKKLLEERKARRDNGRTTTGRPRPGRAVGGTCSRRTTR